MPYPASIPRCQHIKVNGTQCGSPALRRRRFCFFHHQWRQERIAIGAKRSRQGRAFDLPVLEDANSIQITLMQIMRLILRGQIDAKSAGLLLYALQTASVNLRHTEFEPRPQTDIVLDPRDAPDTPLGEHQWYPEDFEEEECEDEADGEEEEEEADEPQDEDQPAEEEPAAASEIKAEAAEPLLQNAGSEPGTNQTNQPRGGGCPHPPGRGPSCRGNAADPANIPANPYSKKPSASRPASPQAPAANDQRQSSASPERSKGTNNPTNAQARWFAPDGTPVTGTKLNQLRLLTHFINCIAPLPPGEKE